MIRRPPLTSANQLMAVELGFFLLCQVAPPSQPYTILPDILNGTVELPNMTEKQLRYISRARLLISQFHDPATWQKQVEFYMNLPEPLQAYDVSSQGIPVIRRVGFGRSRLFTLKRLFD